jgi:hypothetical protein
MAMWRFDQGRTEYHAFESIVELAKALVTLAGKNPSAKPCPIRSYFKSSSPIWDFPPNTSEYTAWRNYARTFALLMLAPNGREVATIQPTDICRELARGTTGLLPTFDDYLQVMLGQWCYPHPAFNEYSHTLNKVFPILAILKMLVALDQNGSDAKLSPDDVFEFLINNNVSGEEPVSFFTSLKKVALPKKSDEKRQVRELLKFISQGSVFTWSAGQIYLAISQAEANQLIKNTKHFTQPPVISRKNQLHQIATLPSTTRTATSLIHTPIRRDDEEFIEGKKIRAFHVKIERNPKLRADFLKTISKPWTCDFCSKSMENVYPWSKDFIEVHHLLPLASAVKIGKTSTLLSDLVPLCPNCHRAVHYAYSDYLKKMSKDDFDDAKEAIYCYENAKKQYILST